MKNYILSFIIGLFSLSAKTQGMFEKSYGGTGSEYGFASVQCEDGGFISVGSTTSFGNGGADIYLIRTSSTGNIKWTKTFGGSNEEYGTCIKMLNDSTVIIGGYSNSFGNGDFNIYVLKVDILGNIIWSNNYGSANDEFAYSIVADDDKYFITGKTAGNGAGGFDGFILSLNNDGSNNWFKTYGGINDELFTSINQTADKGFFLAGITTSFGAGLQDAYVIKVDSLGNKQWSSAFGGIGTDHASAAEETYDGNFIVTGGTDSYGTGGDAFIVKLDSYGNIIWQNTFGGSGNDCGNDIVEAIDAGYVMIGHSASFSSNYNVYLVKVNQWGNVEFSRSLGDSGSDKGYDIQRTRDLGFVISGELNQKMYLMKLNENCKTTCANYEVSQVSSAAFTATSVSDSVSLIPAANLSVYSIGSVSGSGGTVILKCFFDPLISNNDPDLFQLVDIDYVINNEDLPMEKDTIAHTDRSVKPVSGNIKLSSSFEIYPNPGNGSQLNLELANIPSGSVTVSIYSQHGKKHFEKIITVTESTNATICLFPDSQLPPGIYFIRINSGNESNSRKWIVQ